MKDGSYSYQSSLSWKVRIKDTPLTIAFSKTSSIISILVCSVIKVLLLTESFEMNTPPIIKTSEACDRHLIHILQIHLLVQNKYLQSFRKRIKFFTNPRGAQRYIKVEFSMTFN
jgi:hypothetical protein